MTKFALRAAAISAAAFFTMGVPAISTAAPRVIYGADDRKEVYQVTDPGQLAVAHAVGALIDLSRITDNGNGTFTISTTTSTDVCPNQPFASQPMAAFGTCFMVDDDSIATAGAFLDFVYSGDTPLNSFRVVFGFEQTAPNTTNVIVSAADVFTPTAVEVNGGTEYAILTVNQSMTTANRKPLPVRRLGSIADNTRVGIVSYPAGSLAESFSGLPEKVAFGNRTRVYDNEPLSFFTANTDSFNHSDGSPVINQDTLQVEGILFAGDRDFYSDGNCLVVNTVPDSAAFEKALRTVPIKDSLPAIPDVYFTRRNIGCLSEEELHVYNEDESDSAISVLVTTTLSGDSETFTLNQVGATADYSAVINTQSISGAAPTNDGILEVANGDTVSAVYTHNAINYSDQVTADCTAPSLAVSVVSALTTHDSITLQLTSGEPVTASISGGIDCNGTLSATSSGAADTTHQLTISGLQPCTTYFFKAEVADLAGNITTNDNGGGCFTVTTLRQVELYREDFVSAVGWESVAAPTPTSENNWGVRVSAFATSAPTVYSYEPGADTASSSYLISPELPPADVLEFNHTFSFQERSDGGILEISTDNGQSWWDLGDYIIQGGYTRRLTSGSSESVRNPLTGRLAWNGGELGPMTTVRVDMSDFKGMTQNRIRFIFASNDSASSDGWLIDDVRLYDLVDCTATGWTLQ